MARVMIHCPKTGKLVYTHYDFEEIEFDAIPLGKRTLPNCPACGKTHDWDKADAILDEEGGGD